MHSLMSESSIMIAFSKLPDPRRPRNQIYSLEDLVSTSILATLCRCDNYHEISEWTEWNLDWLNSLGICLGGTPSHDTYERFFKYLDSKYFQECFAEWAQLLQTKLQITSISIDGKTLRNSRDGDTRPLHMVSAFAEEASLILGQLTTGGKGGELDGIMRLLEILDIKGAVVTTDAAGCHKVVAEKIVSKKGDYLLALKGNQKNLYAEVVNFLDQARAVAPDEAGYEYWCAEEKSKGGIEKREVWTCDQLDWLPQKSQWPGLRSISCVKRTVSKKDKIRQELRYFISSLAADAKYHGQIIRGHWGIENKLHWQLDVTYREDLSRVRKGNGAENLSVLRRATMHILKQDTKSKSSMKRRRLKASCRREYLLELMGVK